MKRFCFVILMLLFYSISFSNKKEEEKFWSNYIQGNYKTAAEIAKKLGKENNSYYMISSACYHLINEYPSMHLTKNSFDLNNTQNLYILLKNKEKMYKTNYQIYLLLGTVKKFLPMIELSPAAVYFKKSIEINSNNPVAYNELSMIYVSEGDYSNSIICAEKAINISPNFPEPYNNLAYAYYKLGNKSKAIDILIECMNKCDFLPDNTFRSLVNLVCTSGINTIAPNGEVLLVEVPVIKDENVYKRLIDLANNKPRNFIALAEFFVGLNENKQFNKYIKDLVVTSDLMNYKNYVIAQYLYLEGDNENFNKYTDLLIKGDYKDYHRLFSIGNIYFNMKFPDKALRFYLKSLQNVDPLDKDYKLKLYSNIGASYLMQQKFKEALEYMKKALEIFPNDTITLFNLGIANYHLKNKNEAKKYFSKALHSTNEEELKEAIKNWLKEVDKL